MESLDKWEFEVVYTVVCAAQCLVLCDHVIADCFGLFLTGRYLHPTAESPKFLEGGVSSSCAP